MKILENLWQVGGSGLTGPGDAAIYLVRFGDSAALIDAGCGDGHPALLANVARCLPGSVPIRYLLLTHCHFDHTGGAEAVRHDFHCDIVAHKDDAVFLEAGDSEVTAASWYGCTMAPLTVDVHLAGEENVLAIGSGRVTALHRPGHSPGSVVYTARIQDRLVLFGQDVHGPVHPALRSDGTAYLKSLQQLVDLEADLLLEGHFGIIEGKAAVRDFIRSFI
jgi:glyoxylase-like metal-dependent hydrolase (beta-lactamase superfamily II)